MYQATTSFTIYNLFICHEKFRRNKMKKNFIICSIFLSIFSFCMNGCGDNDDSDKQATNSELLDNIDSKESLTILITNPTGENYYVTSSSFIVLEGYASGDPERISCFNSTNEMSVQTSGSSHWSSTKIELVEGDNYVSCTAYNGFETADDRINVTYNKYDVFNSALTTTNNTIFGCVLSVMFRMSSLDLYNLIILK